MSSGEVLVFLCRIHDKLHLGDEEVGSASVPNATFTGEVFQIPVPDPILLQYDMSYHDIVVE